MQDFNTMFTNCYVYNKAGDDITLMAQELEKLFLNKVADMPPEEVEVPMPGKKKGSKGGNIANSNRANLRGSVTGDKPAATAPAYQSPSKVAALANSTPQTSITPASQPANKMLNAGTPMEDVKPPAPTLPAGALPLSQPAKPKKSLKRKADTTTPGPGNIVPPVAPMVYDAQYDTPMKIGKGPLNRRESGRQIKKPRRELPDEQGNVSDASAQHKPSLGKKGKLTEQMKYCSAIVKELTAKKHQTYAWPFLKPVDAEGLGLLDYYDIIKKPMDLGTVKKKMDEREYGSAAEFANDVRQIFHNCYRYNPADSDVAKMGRKLQDVFEMKYARMPDEPVNTDPTPPSLHEDSDVSSDEEDDHSEEEREKKLRELQEQLAKVQEQLTLLTKEHVQKLKEKNEGKLRNK